MRFLANENFPLGSVLSLRRTGHDVSAVVEIEPGAKDPVVLDRAVAEDRILLTFDRGYGELIYRRNLPEKAADAISSLLLIEGLQLERRYTVLERQRVRQRPLP